MIKKIIIKKDTIIESSAINFLYKKWRQIQNVFWFSIISCSLLFGRRGTFNDMPLAIFILENTTENVFCSELHFQEVFIKKNNK